ncbi:MAG: hypothetical protein JW973_13395 [Bacteroidales bacterium]|nr:hypothetical protein [Bacteroidales bacterium]
MPAMLKKIPVNAGNTFFFFIAVTLLVYFFVKVDPSLACHMHQPFFGNNFSFFKYYLSYAGGISDYTGLFIFQFYGNTIVAILLVLLQTGIWCFFVYQLIKERIPDAFIPVPLTLAVIPLIAGHGSYQFTPDISVAFTVALGFAVIYQKLNLKKAYQYIAYLWLAFLVYYLTDSAGLTVFLAGTLALPVYKKKYVKAILFLAIVLSIPVLWYLSDQRYSSLWEAYSGHFITGGREIIPVIINATSGLIFIVLLLSYYSGMLLNARGDTQRLIYINFIVFLPLLFFVTFKITYKPDYKILIRIDRLAYENKWDELLHTADIEIVQKKPVLSLVNRALYQKGIILDYMFFYPQVWRQEALIVQSPTDASITIPLSDIYYDMGLINEARHWANEALTVFGIQPRILERLVKSYIITGQYKTSEKYLNILESSSVTRAWAKKYRRYLYCDDCVKKDPELGRLRQMNPATDFFTAIEDPYDNLKFLATDSLSNKMAFEYLIAYNLLANRPGEVLASLPRFKSMGYAKLPRSCQEAILMYQATKGITVFNDALGYTIDEAIQQNFNAFSGILFGRYKGNPSAAKRSLNKFRQTYWYYYLYSRPLKSSVKNPGSYSEKY